MAIRWMIIVAFMTLNIDLKACIDTSEMFSSPGRVVDEAESIYLGKVTFATINGGNAKFKIEVIDTIKGEVQGERYVESAPSKHSRTVLRGKHDDVYFWTHRHGGTTIGADCKITPNLRIGHIYLIINGSIGTALSVEEIVNPKDDLWLEFVEDRVKSVDDGVFTVEGFFEQFSSIYLAQCTSDSRSSKGGPSVKRIIRGADPGEALWPASSFTCGQSGRSYLVVSDGDDNKPVIYLPVEKEVVYFDSIANQYEIVPKNQISLRVLTEME